MEIVRHAAKLADNDRRLLRWVGPWDLLRERWHRGLLTWQGNLQMAQLPRRLPVDWSRSATMVVGHLYRQPAEARALPWPRAACMAKRACDVVFSTLGLIALSPLLLLVAAAIKLSDPGPALFWQPRVGRGGKSILVCKFRTMYVAMGDPTGVSQTMEDDPRVTPIGRFLRQRSIDELPQLINVLKGEMSLVGPRAHAVGMTVCGFPYETIVPNYHERHQVRPGMTGLAQIRGLRGPVTDVNHAQRRVAADLEYIREFNFVLDVHIVVRTVLHEMWMGSGV